MPIGGRLHVERTEHSEGRLHPSIIVAVAVASVALSPLLVVYEAVLSALLFLVVLGSQIVPRFRTHRGTLASFALALLIGPVAYLALWALDRQFGW